MRLAAILNTGTITALKQAAGFPGLLERVVGPALRYRRFLGGSAVALACASVAVVKRNALQESPRVQEALDQKQAAQEAAMTLVAMQEAFDHMPDPEPSVPDAFEFIAAIEADEMPLVGPLALTFDQLRTLAMAKQATHDQLWTDTQRAVQERLTRLQTALETMSTNGHETLSRRATARNLVAFFKKLGSVVGLDGPNMRTTIHAVQTRLQEEMAIPMRMRRRYRLEATTQGVTLAKEKRRAVRHLRAEVLEWLQGWRRAIETKLSEAVDAKKPEPVRQALATVERLGDTPTAEAVDQAFTGLQAAVSAYNERISWWFRDQRLPTPEHVELVGATGALREYEAACQAAATKLQDTGTRALAAYRGRGATEQELGALMRYRAPSLQDIDLLADTNFAYDTGVIHTIGIDGLQDLELAIGDVASKLRERPGLGDVLRYAPDQENDLYSTLAGALVDLERLEEPVALTQSYVRNAEGRLQAELDDAATRIVRELGSFITAAQHKMHDQIADADQKLARLNQETVAWVWASAAVGVAALLMGIRSQFRGAAPLLVRSWKHLNQIA